MVSKRLRKEKPVIFCGDLNVAHEEIDLKNPKSNRHSAGFSDEERGKMTELLGAGFIDTFTKVGFGIKSTYAGKLPLLRIDYIWANDNVKPLDFERHKYKASDHYPIILDFKIQ